MKNYRIQYILNIIEYLTLLTGVVCETSEEEINKFIERNLSERTFPFSWVNEAIYTRVGQTIWAIIGSFSVMANFYLCVLGNPALFLFKCQRYFGGERYITQMSTIMVVYQKRELIKLFVAMDAFLKAIGLEEVDVIVELSGPVGHTRIVESYVVLGVYQIERS